MCKTKNFIIEVIEGAESKRIFVVREIAQLPNVPPVTRLCTDDPQEIASFLSSDSLFPSNDKD